MNRTRIRRWGALTLSLLLLCLLLCGCRESPVLEKTIYTQLAEEVDEEEEILSPEEEEEEEEQPPEDEQFDQEQSEQAETERDTTPDRGLYDQEQAPDASQAVDVDYSALSNKDWENDSQPEPGSTPGEASQPEEPDPEEESDIQPDASAGAEGTFKQVVDAAGRLVDVPEHVETAAAAGAGAQMVEMLGGPGRLVAADEQFLSSPLALSAFSDLNQVEIWWSGNGSSPLSSTAMERLLEVRPDVCLEFSGQQSFTNAQVERLSEAGIAYVVLPALSSQKNLEQAVTLVGQILGGDAESIAQDYNSWVDRTVSTVGGNTPDTDLTSLYLCAWDENAAYQLTETKDAIEPYGTGLAVAYSPTKPQLVSTFMKAAHVTNESTRIASLHRTMQTVYVAPMFHQLNAVVEGSAAAFYSGAGEYGAAYDLFITRQVSASVYYQLGSLQYPAVIAADEETAAAVRGDWFWQYRESNANGYVTINGQEFYRGVNGEYAVLINPQGMCGWAEGSVESPLEAYWIAYALAGSYTLEQVKEQTAQFYAQFFHLTLSQEQLDAMFPS